MPSLTSVVEFAAHFEVAVFLATFVVCVCVLSLKTALFILGAVFRYAFPRLMRRRSGE